MLSLYTDRAATPYELEQAVQKLSAAFPIEDKVKSATFFALLVERMKENGFTAQRVKDAVNYVIDNFHYKQINIADVVKFDKCVKLYTYAEMLQSPNDFAPMLDERLNPKKINGKLYYVRLSEDPEGMYARRALQKKIQDERRRYTRQRYDEEVNRITADYMARRGMTEDAARKAAVTDFHKTELFSKMQAYYNSIPEPKPNDAK